MPEKTFIEALYIAGAAVVGALGSVIGFSGNYQTKGDCAKSRDAYELVQTARGETVEAKLHSIEQSSLRTEKLVEKMAGDFYRPRGTHGDEGNG